MANALPNATPLYGKIILLNNDQLPKPKEQKTGKNMDRTRTEARNGKVEPVRSEEDLKRICDYLYQNGQYRDWCMFIVGINCGLRVSDLVRLRVSDVSNFQKKELLFRVKPVGTKFMIVPKKTSNQRKYVEIILNQAMYDVLVRYFDLVGTPSGEYYEYFIRKGWLFPTVKSSVAGSKRTENNPKDAGDPIDEDSFGKALRKCQQKLNLPYKIGTHTPRKTFGYRFFRQYQKCGGESFALARLQEIFQHSSQLTTLTYIGISDEERRRMIESYYCGLDPKLYK